MEKNYLEFIKKFLGESPVMDPTPTQMKPVVKADSSIKAVVVDVYGTIMISASGDVDESDISTENLKDSLNAAGIKMSDSVGDSQQFLTDMLISFRDSILQVHENDRRPDKPYPEIDILKIWENIIRANSSKNYLVMNGPLCIKCFTFAFEILCNNIYPMPGMKEVINTLAQKGIPLGIISNAQFYTPAILNFFINGKISDEEDVEPFDSDLTVFSYQHMRSKPDQYLFKLVINNCLKKYRITAPEILFLGNDMFRDIYPASKAGFKTALFAGDGKSLRLRQGNPEINTVKPDFIITDLRQMLEIVK